MILGTKYINKIYWKPPLKIFYLCIYVFILIIVPKITADSLQQSFDRADSEYDLNNKLLRAIAIHESGLNQYEVGFVLKDPIIIAAADKDLIASPVKYKKRPYKRWYHYSLSFQDSKQALSAIPWLEKATATSTGFDIGLMQINSRNAHRNGWSVAKLLDEPSYNVDKGAKILNDCRTLFKSNPRNTLECYNKGIRASTFDYEYYAAVYEKYSGKKIYIAKQKEMKKIPKKAEDAFALPKYYGYARTFF